MFAKALIVIFALLVVTTGADAADSAPNMFVVHFETGSKWDKSLAPADQIGFREHSANLGRLRKEGTIVFGARYGELGMIIVKTDTLETAKTIVEADPGVRAGIFSYRIAVLNVFYPWQQ